MIKIILFEAKKIMRSTFFFILFAILGLLLVGYYTFVYQHTVRVDELIVDLENKVQMEEQYLQDLSDMIENSETGATRELWLDFEISERLLSKDLIILSAYKAKDWRALLEVEIESAEESVRNDQQNQTSYLMSTHPSRLTSETRLDYYKWLYEKRITPVLPINFFSWYTVYDVDFGFPEVERFIKETSNKYSSTGVHFLNHVVKASYTIFGVFAFLFLFGDILTKEGLGRNGPINFLQTQPLQRFRIFLGKILTLLILSFVILVIMSFISILIGTLFDGFGHLNYPVLIYGEEYTFTFISMGTFIFLSSLLFLLVLLFSYSLLFFFSILTKRTLTAVGLTVATIYIGILWSEDTILSSISPYIPFHYFSVSDIVTNTFAASNNNFSFSLMNGCFVLFVATLLILTITFLVFRFQSSSTITFKKGGAA